MQSYNKFDKLISTKQDTLDKLTEEIKDLGEKATHHVIGAFPQKDQILTVNGLRFRITFSNEANGKFQAKILKPEDITGVADPESPATET